MRKYNRTIRIITVLRRDEVDVTVTEGTARGGVTADAHRGEAFKFGEGVEKQAIGDIRVQVTNVERSRSGRDGRRNRH